jgi:site-specific recombinase XerD
MGSSELRLWDDAGEVVEVLDGSEVSLAVLEQRARSYEAESKSANTWRAYRSDLRHFGAWCASRGVVAMPAAPETVRLYLVDHAGKLSINTLRRRLSAISEAHVAAQVPNPTVSPVVRFAWEGMRRSHGSAPRTKEAAVTEVVTEVVTAMVKPLGKSLIDVRDRAILLIGFAGAMRRSELASLEFADVTETGDGLRITVGRSKTDQEGEGAVVGITYGSNPPTCPVRAWRAWVEAAQLVDGPAFRQLGNGRVTDKRITGDGIARMLKRRATAAGLDPELFSGHSLRSGFATTAARAGVAEHKIMRQGRWTTSAAMRGYIREGELFVDNPSAKLGL